MKEKKKNTPKLAIFRMCDGENGTVKFFETLADNVFKHNYPMIQIFKKLNDVKIWGLPRPTPTLKYIHSVFIESEKPVKYSGCM